MKKKLEQLKSQALETLKQIKDDQALQKLETEYLGRKGKLTQILRQIVDLKSGERKTVGGLANEIKKELQQKFKQAKASLASELDKAAEIDITLPGKKIAKGSLHPLTLVKQDLAQLFISMGFMILDGPELESDYYNFEALNIPAFHPARDIQDTFYIDKRNKEGDNDLLLRTHTSPVQVRAMQKYGAPLRCVAIGRCFRSEATDATHEHTFNQIEGLMIDRGINITHLISVVQEMLEGIFKQKIKVRVRPGYFPFVEPGLEFDMSCTICQGKSCPSCKHSGWLEIMGAGMVHPNVLQAGGIDPEEFSSFAFGLGIERLTMMKYGINDIRLFNSGDLRFLKQF